MSTLILNLNLIPVLRVTFPHFFLGAFQLILLIILPHLHLYISLIPKLQQCL